MIVTRVPSAGPSPSRPGGGSRSLDRTKVQKLQRALQKAQREATAETAAAAPKKKPTGIL